MGGHATNACNGCEIIYKYNAKSVKKKTQTVMVFTIRERQRSNTKCMFAEDCQYYDQDGVACNEYVHINPCPQYNKKIRDLRKRKVEHWERLMEQFISANTVNEEKIITDM